MEKNGHDDGEFSALNLLAEVRVIVPFGCVQALFGDDLCVKVCYE